MNSLRGEDEQVQHKRMKIEEKSENFERRKNVVNVPHRKDGGGGGGKEKLGKNLYTSVKRKSGDIFYREKKQSPQVIRARILSWPCVCRCVLETIRLCD